MGSRSTVRPGCSYRDPGVLPGLQRLVRRATNVATPLLANGGTKNFYLFNAMGWS